MVLFANRRFISSGSPSGSFIFKVGAPRWSFYFGDGSSNATWMVGVHNIGAIKFAIGIRRGPTAPAERDESSNNANGVFDDT